ncbi:Bug family tripartite tricarboxylate transporter substrate binding protein [Ramlibacter alkalitolerans]|uniref:Tripartite tricarboxylate transporter substrate binding protein n=1 Tax=Ramlibacter alkalitolerans TaxID=2039631 RepID=A0ABS1JV56_9BURK|nr:tripartite tricarboxylate transporter substrate binding protein [Ramlibacter alkalitolerans]MBL0428099.1 tripartite tricarboxylate transporter substrate binding protein [Ramlibacter alkalitolerans]
MHRTDRTRRRLLQAALASPAVVALPALAQAFPSRPIRLICPWPAGGSTDAVMRSLAESASKTLGGQVIVENKPGASGMLGPNELVGARPDGYTLSQLTIGIARLPHMQKMQFDPLKDFTYIACLTGYTFGLVVRADSPVKTVQELVDWCKANPGKFSFGSPGNGTTPHLAVEEFAFRAGIKMQHVPFKGVAEGMQALLGGHIMSHSDSTGWASHVDAGTMRLLATYGSKRTRRWPNVPTLHELGYETLADSPFGIGGPRGMDPAITRRLHDGFRKALEDPAVLATFERYDQSVIYMNSADYEKFIREQYVKEKEIIEKLGLAMKA